MKSNLYYNIIIFINFIAFGFVQPAEQTKQADGTIIASRSPITLPTPTHEVRSDGTSSEPDSSHSHSSSEQLEKIDLVRKLSRSSLPKFKTKSKVHFDQRSAPLSRNYFNRLESILGVLVISAGAYKAYNFFTHRSEGAPITRGGVPTDMVGAAFWGASKLSSIASSGFTVIIAAYAGHKIKNFVDKLYENRFHKMLQPVMQDLEALATYVDERINPLAEGQEFLCDVVEQVTQGQENLADSQKRLIIFINPLIKDHQEEHPTSTRIEELAPELQEIQEQVIHTASQAHNIGLRIDAQKHNLTATDPANPITSKTKYKRRCCDMC